MAENRIVAAVKKAWPAAYARWATPVLIVLVIGVLGAQMAGMRWEKIKDVQFIGHSDEAAYGEMGKSLVKGNGLQVPYITWFFIPYDPGVTRREDHWPPFISFCMVPFFLKYGISAAVAKLPSVLIGAIGLPLATALLAWQVSRRGYVAIFAGLIVMANHMMYTESLKTLSDVPAAMLLAFFCWAMIAARRSPWMHVAAGVFAALSYYAKGSEIVLVGLYPGLAVLMTGFHVPGKGPAMMWGAWVACVLVLWGIAGGAGLAWMAPVFLMAAPGLLMIAGPAREKAHWPWLGIAAAVLLLAPFLYSNYKLFGNPVHSTQNYIAGYHGLEEWEAPSYYVYWGKHLPSVQDRWENYGRGEAENVATGEMEPTHVVGPRKWDTTAYPREYATYTADQRAEMARMILLGVDEEGQENAWDSLGYVGRGWEDFFRGKPVAPAGSEPDRTKDRRPALGVNALRWNGSKGFIGALWQFVGEVYARSAGWKNPLPRVTGLLAAGTVLVVLPAGLLWWAGVWGWRMVRRARGGKMMEATPAERPALFWGPVMALALLVVIHAGFLVYFWRVQPRFAFPMVPLITAIGCAGLGRLLDAPLSIGAKIGAAFVKPAWAKVLIRNWHLPVTLCFAVYFLGSAARLKADYAAEHKPYERDGWPYRDPWADKGDRGRWEDTRNMVIGAYLKTHEEFANAVIMCRNPWEILFYAADNQKGVAIPYARPETVFAVARYYRVTHLLFDPDGIALNSRPELRSWLQSFNALPESQRPFKRVATVEGAVLYELDYSKLPNEALPGMTAVPADPPKFVPGRAATGNARQ